MKKVLVYFLLLILAFPMISPWGTVTYFVINRDYIEKVLCENRNRPSLHCNGKCFLAKKLKQQWKAAEKDAVDSLKGLSWTSWYYQDFDHLGFEFRIVLPKLSVWEITYLLYYPSCLPGVFHPPRHFGCYIYSLPQ